MDITCSLCTVYEHDMDVMLMQAILTDPGFLGLFIDKTDWSGLGLRPIHAELANSDVSLGETDITVILSDGISQYALLLEDKIDAVAQPDQHDRYVKRGDKAVRKGLYTDYKVFIVCPKKYYDSDDEAKKYEHFVSYEECAEYFSKSSDRMNSIRYQEVMQAISKAKRPPQVNFNENANSFFRKYREYQREHYPQLEMRTKETSNGYWVDYKIRFPYQQAYLLHKLADGEVDITFNRGKEKAPILDSICDWFNKNGLVEISAPITGKSVALRMNVPKLQYKHGWENLPKEDIDKCFVTIMKMVDLAKLFNDIQRFLTDNEDV